MEPRTQFLKLFHVQSRRWLFVVGLVAFTHLLFQSLLLPYGKFLQSLLPDGEVPINDEGSLPILKTSTKSVMVRNPLTINSSDKASVSAFKGFVKDGDISNVGRNIGHDSGQKGIEGHAKNGFTSKRKAQNNSIELVTDREVDNIDIGHDSGQKEIEGHAKNGFTSERKTQDKSTELVTDREVDNGSKSENVEDLNDNSSLNSVTNEENSTILELAGEARRDDPLERIVKPNWKVSTDNIQEKNASQTPKSPGGVETASSMIAQLTNISSLKTKVSNASSFKGFVAPQSDLATSKNISITIGTPGKKKMRCELPPKSITSIYEMNRILRRHRRSSRAMRPRWSSIRDQEILAARTDIEKAPSAVNDRDLYAPLFRNVSMFKRSYELMDRTLKVYVYRDGKKPIFHQPILKGLYASEGWFMKLMEGNKRFVVKDPRKAHLFYMPFSSRMLEYTLYERNSHNRTNLRQYLKDYTEKIAAKYRYWNRTGGADHFLVACHDWAPYETRHHMEHCIKALCNADVTAGFKLGRDVSLPETYVRAARNPLRDLGGRPPSRRHILAFYAGNMHGYLRPILLKHWKDRDPNMKIFGPMPPGVASKMDYIQHMKSSKYCICPKGYEVNSPRVVEAIFYECVPVIISDNFVPPFFEVLDWRAFSVIIAESEIPNLKDILLSIPQEKYLRMQLAVRKVQRHFLWHAKPEKYDLFYMTLHSIWYNRVYQIKPR